MKAVASAVAEVTNVKTIFEKVLAALCAFCNDVVTLSKPLDILFILVIVELFEVFSNSLLYFFNSFSAFKTESSTFANSFAVISPF